MENPFTQPAFKGNKSRVLLLITAILLGFNTFAKLSPPPPTPTVVVTLPSGANCYSSLTASGCDAGNTVYWYNNGSSYYNQGATITAFSSLPLFLTAKCYDSGTGTFGPASVENKVFPAGYTELSPKTTQSLCAAVTSVLFNASSAASGLTYQWRKGFSNVSGATGSSYTATTTDYYDVVATSGSCTYTSQSVQVVNATVPIIYSYYTGSCGSNSIYMYVSNVSGGTFQWKLNGVNISGATASNYTAPVTSTAANYTVDFTSGSCVTTSLPVSAIASATFIPAVSPACFVTLKSTGCPEYTSWFKFNGSNWVIENYSYSSSYNILPATVSDYKAICGYTSTYCANIASNTITAIPNNYTTISPVNPSFCSTGSVLLTANSTFSGLTYQWKLGSSNISGATSSTYTAATAGNYSVVSTSGSCSFTSGIAVVTSVTPPTISITSPVSSPATITNGQSLVLTSNGCISSGGTVLWSNSATTSTITVTPASNASYTFTCTKTPCVVTSSAFVVNVSPLLPPTITSSSPTTCTGTSVTITGTCLGGSTISWNTSPVQTTSVITVSPSVTTTYTATCTSGAVTSNASISIGVFNGPITSLSSGNWTDASTWSCNCIPASCNDVTVEVGHNVMIPPSLTGRLQNLNVKGSVDLKNLSTMKMK
jgi:large repetitive protein